MYIESSKIKVFPYGSNRAADPYARVLNEQNITNLVKMLTDNSSYVISYNDNLIKFVIDGYYFEANISDITLSSTNPDVIYAKISIESCEDETTKRVYTYLAGGDINGEFRGVEFAYAKPETTTNFLLLLTKDDKGNYVVPKDSKMKFNVDMIDCGSAEGHMET